MHLLARHRQFAILWAAGWVSSLAGWCLGMAQAIHVYDLTRSPLATAGITIAATLPSAAFGSVGGLIGDRADRIRLLKIVSLTRVGVVASLLLVGDHAATLLAVVFVQAVALQLFTPAEQATVADLVPASDLPAAAGANSTALNVTRLAGPALGGTLMTTLGFRPAIALIVAALALSSVLVWRLRPTPHHHRSRGPGPASLRSDWLAGVRLIATQPSARGVACLQVLDACKEGAFNGLFPVLMLGVIGTSSAFMGIVNSAFALTAVLAGPTIAFTIRRLGYRTPIAAGAGTSGLLLLLLALHPTPASALAVMALSGYPFTLSWVAANTLLLTQTTPTHRARAIGTINSIYGTATLTSAALAGLAANHLDTPTVIAAAATLETLAAPTFLLLTRHMEARPATPPSGAATSGPARRQS